MDHYKEGMKAAIQLYGSKHYQYISKPVRPEDAMKVFLPPIPQTLMQIPTPVPADREQWLRGFREEQETILEELKILEEK